MGVHSRLLNNVSNHRTYLAGPEKECNNAWDKLTSSCVLETPWIRVEKHDVIENGMPNVYWVVGIKDGVVIAPLTEDFELFLVGQCRYAINSFSWETIGGAVDEGETPLQAAKRELREETGLEANRWTCLGNADLGTAFLRCKIWFYIAEDLKQGRAQPDQSELLTVWKLPLAEAVDMVWTGKITHLPSITLILKVKEVFSGSWPAITPVS